MTSVTLASGGGVAAAAVAGSPYDIVPSAAVGTGLGNYAISYDNGALSVNPAPAGHHRGQPQQDLRDDGDVCRDGVYDQRSGQRRHGGQCDVD